MPAMFERNTPQETLQAQVGRILCLKPKAEFEVKQGGEVAEPWAHVLTLLEFVEKLGSCYGTAEGFVAATRRWLLHEHHRVLKASGSLPAPEGTYEKAVQEWGDAKNVLLGISEVPSASVKGRYEAAIKELTAAKNDAASFKSQLEVLRKEVDSSDVARLRSELARERNAAQTAKSELAIQNGSIEQLRASLAKERAEAREARAESEEQEDERIAELTEEVQMLKRRLKVQRTMYEDILKEQGKLIARAGTSPKGVKKARPRA